MRIVALFVAVLLVFACMDVRATDTAPIRVTPCELLSDPGHYDHALVQVYGLVSYAFEQFDMSEGECKPRDGMMITGLWLEYGGKRQSQTVYCCSNAVGADRKETLVVEGVRCELVDDAVFKTFDRLLHRRRESSVTATIVGRFFAGRESEIRGKRFWGGYGHMGFASLLVVEQVLSVEPATYAPYATTSPAAFTGPLPTLDPLLFAPAK
jgi:hypothetical protein